MKGGLLGRAVLDIVQLTLLWVGLIFGCLAAGLGVYEAWFLHRVDKATATVVSMDVHENVDANGNVSVSYAPVFTFTAQGREVTVHAAVGGNEEAYRIGQTVPVLYAASDAQHAEIDSLGQKWGLAIAFGIAAAACGLVGGAMRLSRGARGFPLYLFEPGATRASA